MELIIKIPDEAYELLKSKPVLDNIGESIIANGIPYKPTGDLISREALRKDIDFQYICKCCHNVNGNVCDICHISEIEHKIDNAPPVEAFTKEDMAGAYNEGYACGGRESKRPNEQIAWEQGFEAGLAQAVEITEEQAINKLHETGWLIGHDKEMTDRPKGEWYYGEDECGQDGWFCSECNFFVPWYYQYYEKDINFIREYKACPHCLAEMVTYTGKDRDTKGGAE